MKRIEHMLKKEIVADVIVIDETALYEMPVKFMKQVLAQFEQAGYLLSTQFVNGEAHKVITEKRGTEWLRTHDFFMKGGKAYSKVSVLEVLR